MTVCAVCNTTLVKQYVHPETGNPLSAREEKEISAYQEWWDRLLECQHCGDVCLQPAKDAQKNGYYSDGTIDACKPCGGTFPVPRVRKEVPALWQKCPKVWSCPVHGTAPVREGNIVLK